MSENLRIALVVEGGLEYPVIHAALEAVLPEPFILVQLQPESTEPRLGGGWCGVVKWCHEIAQRHNGSLIEDPTFQINPYDLIIIHVDVDVALFHYSDCKGPVENLAQENGWESLPCAQTCPPVEDTVNALVEVIKSWLGKAKPDNYTLFCLPAQSSGTWLAAAVLPPSHPLLSGGECEQDIEKKLDSSVLRKGQRIKKSKRSYRNQAPNITAQWEQVKQICSQAEQFEHSVLAALNLDCESPA